MLSLVICESSATEKQRRQEQLQEKEGTVISIENSYLLLITTVATADTSPFTLRAET